MSRIIRKHAKDAAAVVGLFVIALVVGGYILANQRLTLPGWVPGVGKDFFTLNAEFSTAQAVTPGQGQTVNVAGVKVGEIAEVKLVDGRARVKLKLEEKYGVVYEDATMLLRPKTGLKDMIIELTPGTPTAGKLRSGAVVPIQNTLPDINPDEVLAALDGDTREYLTLLLSGGREGLEGNGGELADTIRRFEPTARDARRISGALATRRENLRRLIHNFQLLSTELAGKEEQIAGFVDSSNAVFAAFARQEANLRQTLRELPPTLRATDRGLTKADRLARQLGPTLQSLRPSARALGPTLRRVRPFLQDTIPIIRTELRPFTRQALPVVRRLRPTAAALSAIAPDLTNVGRVVNYLLNTLAYNPPGEEEGFLYWTAWANHAANTVFGTQDAHGPVRHGILLASCSALAVLEQLTTANEVLKTIIDNVNAPLQSEVCPDQSAPGVTP